MFPKMSAQTGTIFPHFLLLDVLHICSYMKYSPPVSGTGFGLYCLVQELHDKQKKTRVGKGAIKVVH